LETIPDGLPPSDADSTQHVPSLCDSTKKNCLAPFRDLLSRLNNTSSSKVPPVTCIVSDCVMSFTLKAAQELGIPNVLFWTASVCGFMSYLQYRPLIEKGFVPLKGKNLFLKLLAWLDFTTIYIYIYIYMITNFMFTIIYICIYDKIMVLI
jgi:hypothetical protein